MKKENEVIVNFQVEELEKRFEMGWGENIANAYESKMGVHQLK